jgi:hypothetical protein
MKRATFIITVFTLLLSACGGSQPAPTVTGTTALTNTSIPTVTQTATPTVPMIEVDGIKVSDPKVTTPELFDLKNPDSPIVQFANAFGVKPEEVGDLTPKLLKDANEEQFAILTTQDIAATANFDETGIPLLLTEKKENGKWVWKQANQRNLIKKLHPIFLIGATAHYPIYGDEFNRPDLAGFLGDNFNSLILENHLRWNGVEKNQGVIDSTRMQQVKQIIEFAKDNNQTLLGQHLFFYTEYPDWLKNGKFTKEELQKIIENRTDTIMKGFP